MNRIISAHGKIVEERVFDHTSTDAFYEEHAAEYFERTVDADMSSLYERFLPWVPNAGRILDIGCGSGRDLREFTNRGYRPVGLDSSRALVELARTHSGAPCFVGRLEEINYDGCFDGIWACASLLHVSKRLIVPVLNRLHVALVPSGVLFASVQQGEGERCSADGRYFSYYMPTEIASAVTEAGFVIKELWFSEDMLPGRTSIKWINLLATKSSRSNIP